MASSGDYCRQMSTLMHHEEFKSTGLPEDYVFCSVFLNGIGDIEGKKILDLACGAGYYSRKMKCLGADEVVGVEKSSDMLAQARAKETAGKLGIKYIQSDVAGYIHREETSNNENKQRQFDVVTAAFLLQFAPTKDVLRSFCESAYNNLLPYGRFVALSNGDFNENNVKEDYVDLYGWECEILSESENEKPVDLIKDGRKMRTTLFSGDRNVYCIFDDFVWSFATIKEVLEDVGFRDVEKTSVCETMVMVISATKEE